MEPVHPTRGQAVWIEATGDLAGTLVYCNLCSVSDGAPSHVHSTPETYLAPSLADARRWAEKHAEKHENLDSVSASVKTMPRNAHLPAKRGRPRIRPTQTGRAA